jgi:hypothetical protein
MFISSIKIELATVVKGYCVDAHQDLIRSELSKNYSKNDLSC